MVTNASGVTDSASNGTFGRSLSVSVMGLMVRAMQGGMEVRNDEMMSGFPFDGEPQAQSKPGTDACGLPLND